MFLSFEAKGSNQDDELRLRLTLQAALVDARDRPESLEKDSIFSEGGE
jgi:hypothetical protein